MKYKFASKRFFWLALALAVIPTFFWPCFSWASNPAPAGQSSGLPGLWQTLQRLPENLKAWIGERIRIFQEEFPKAKAEMIQSVKRDLLPRLENFWKEIQKIQHEILG